ncbi:phospholipid/cholesterol/gamma-HCH transport system substrate-binding protein [Nocardia transvalensis]|uniref:Phospholipid/cholesterol/gamma-HCH transport system substrate-binding protein n=1 Tax=Nocardia transvalensis TaxID=37333 RepID=A0A7W9PLF3_9NOCA|nr:MCE family protein [Nocardia transvalensis]MBB5917818.1 phospholipid/cholesterol/gamma-HCH transport system substrate-binding protein [Nocardia transvalensis]
MTPLGQRRLTRVHHYGIVAVVLGLVVLAGSGCGWRGVNSLPLPGTAGHGEGSYAVRIEMPDVSTIQRNSPVLVSDVTVGSVTGLSLSGQHALVTVRLDGGVRLPENATAKLGQTSLLGSTHIELAPPATEPARGELRDGALIPLARAGSFPTTEQTLSSMSLVLSGGGLAQIHDISSELNGALSGRENAVRDLLAKLDTLVRGLDGQKQDIVDAIAGLDALNTRLAARHDEIGTAIAHLEPALTVIRDRRVDLTRALTGLGDLGCTATALIGNTRDNLDAELRDLQPVLASLADAGSSLTDSLRYLLTYPFPIDTYANAVRGDYANGEVTLDLRLRTLDNALLLGTPLQGMLSGLEAVVGHTAPGPVQTAPTPLPGLLNPEAPR